MPGKINLSFAVLSDLKHPDLKPDSQFSDNFFNLQDIEKLKTNKMISLLDLGLTQKMIEVDEHHLIITLSKNLIIFKFTASYTNTNQYHETTNIPFTKEKRSPLLYQKKSMNNAQILIVEDNVSNQQILTLYIKKHVKKIDIANNGKEALNKVATTKYDLILMDVQMPVMDGFKATEKIRELENTSDSRTPIIAVTANAFPEDEIRCLEAGMDSYISKPFNPDQLLDKMKHFLDD
jgi:CheY-like chemotaxis protein